MNLPSVSPNANTPTDTRIRPMPARRAERSSEEVEIVASKLISDRDVPRFVRAGLVPAIHANGACCLKDVDARDKPGHDELNGIDCRAKPSAIPISQQTLANLAGTRHGRVRSRSASHGAATALVRGFCARRALCHSKPYHHIRAIRRVSPRAQRYPSGALRHRLLSRPRHAEPSPPCIATA